MFKFLLRDMVTDDDYFVAQLGPVPIKFVGHMQATIAEIDADRRFYRAYNRQGKMIAVKWLPSGFYLTEITDA